MLPEVPSQLGTWTSMVLLVFSVQTEEPSLDLGVAALELRGPK